MTWKEYITENWPSYGTIEDIVEVENRRYEQAMGLWEEEKEIYKQLT